MNSGGKGPPAFCRRNNQEEGNGPDTQVAINEVEREWLIGPSDAQYFDNCVITTKPTDWIGQHDLRRINTSESRKAEHDFSTQPQKSHGDDLISGKPRREPSPQHLNDRIDRSLDIADQNSKTQIPDLDISPQLKHPELATCAEAIDEKAIQQHPSNPASAPLIQPAVMHNSVLPNSGSSNHSPHSKSLFLDLYGEFFSTRSIQKTDENLEANMVDYYMYGTEAAEEDGEDKVYDDENVITSDQSIWQRAVGQSAELASRLGWSKDEMYVLAEILAATKCHHRTMHAIHELLFEHDVTPHELSLIRQVRISWQHGLFARAHGESLFGERSSYSLSWKDCLALVRIVNADSYEELDFFMQECLAIWEQHSSFSWALGREFKVFFKGIIDELESHPGRLCYGLIELYENGFKCE